MINLDMVLSSMDTPIATTTTTTTTESSINEKFTTSDKVVMKSGFTKTTLKDGHEATKEEWMVASGLDFKVEESPIEYGDGYKDITRKAVYRSDTGHIFGVFKEGYKAVQNTEMYSLIYDYCEKLGGKVIQSGYVDNGAKVYALAQLDKPVNIAGSEKGSKNLLVLDSRDGSTGFTVRPFVNRFICSNQFQVNARLYNKTTHRHTKGFNLSDVAQILETFEEGFRHSLLVSNRLAEQKVKDREALALLCKFNGVDKPIDVSTKLLNIILDQYNLYRGEGLGAENEEAKGTLWGVLNAVTEYQDHHTGRNENNRFKTAYLGKGNQIKSDTFNCLESILNRQEFLPALSNVEYEHILTAESSR